MPAGKKPRKSSGGGKPGSRKKEQRKEPRVPYKNLLTGFNLLQPGARSPKQSFKGTIVDLSDSGIGLSLEGGTERETPSTLFPFFEEGTLVRLRVPITENHVTMPVLGQIIWKTPSKKKNELRAGIRFII